MLKKFIAVIFMMVTMCAYASETITIASVLPPSSGVFANWLTLINEANKIQSKYVFRIEPHVGAQGLIALNFVNASPTNRIATTYPAYAELVSAKKIDPNDYEPVFMYGETCWALIANVGDQSIGIDSLAAFKGKELIVGTPAIGNAMHLTGIMIADKYQFKVKPVLFKSQYDALIEMTANDTVNLVLNEVHNFETMKQRNPKLQMLGMSCPTRFKGAPNIKTLKEQGVNSPRIYTASLASTKMPVETRKEIEKIFEQAVVSIGEDALAKDTIVSPTLMGQSSTAKFKEVNEYLMKLQTKYKKEINDN